MTLRGVALFGLALAVAVPSAAEDLKLFRERNFGGAMMVLGESNSSFTFSPRAVRIGKGGAWLICPRPFFGGECKTITADTANLSLPRAFSGTVKSARPVAAVALPPQKAPDAPKP